MSANQDPWVLKDEAIATAAGEPRCVAPGHTFVGSERSCVCGERIREEFLDQAGRPRDLSLRDVLEVLARIEAKLDALSSDGSMMRR